MRFTIAKNIVDEQKARDLAAAVVCAPNPPYAAGFLGGGYEIEQIRQRAREREQWGEPSAFPRIADFFLAGPYWGGASA